MRLLEDRKTPWQSILPNATLSPKLFSIASPKILAKLAGYLDEVRTNARTTCGTKSLGFAGKNAIANRQNFRLANVHPCSQSLKN
ncbi:MAG: hypothetical protein U0894_11985 [Pirellulales bacterium]